jgi:lipopolysaccharide export system permease protein
VKFFTALDRYIFRLVLMPMLAVFVVAASLLMLDKMLKLFDFVGSQGGPVQVVFSLLMNMVPEYASLAIPLGLMLGVLMAFRRLATSSELDVMRAVGLSYTRLLRVPYLMALVLAVCNLFIVSYVQPYSRYLYEQLTFELSTGALGASIRVGEFNTLRDRMSLRIEQSRDEGRELIGIFMRVTEQKGQVLSITARQGRFLALHSNPDTVILRLTDGQIVQNPVGQPPRVLAFTRHDLPIDLPSVEKFRMRGGVEREYFLPELLKLGWSKDTSEETRNVVRASLNYRLAEVVMILLLPLLAVSLAVPPKRSSSALGVFISIVMVVAYHKVNEYGEQVSSLGKIDPWLGLWVPFGVFAAIIIWMYWTLAYVPGGQPIGALERFFSNVVKRLTRLIGKKKIKGFIPETPGGATDEDDQKEQAA